MLDLAALDPAEKARLAALLAEVRRRQNTRLLATMFPDEGPLRRELYPRHLEFFANGRKTNERVFMAGNRVGKTVGAGVEWSYHLTGMYPDWWPGRTFGGPIRLLASGDTHETTRDIIQAKLVGGTTDQPQLIGTGLVPGDSIVTVIPRPHVRGAIERVVVRRVSGGGDVSNAGESELWLRSYVQGREIFQGFELDGFWPDEECPQDVYEEGMVRLMTRAGMSTLTFTPLNGLTELVQEIQRRAGIEDAPGAPRITTCTWDDVPHLSEQAKAEMMAKLPPHQRDARTKGIPALGAGAIYPVPEEDITCDPFELPDHWARAYGLDVGWNRTAGVWGAHDRETDVVYLYSEHYRGQSEPAIHAEAVKARGDWIPGAIDPAARGRSQIDGEQLLAIYERLGLRLTPADNSVESGIYDVWERLSTGRLKVFKTLHAWLSEYRIYRRDDKGKVVKQADHAMDATRYLIKTGLGIARTQTPRFARRARDWKTS